MLRVLADSESERLRAKIDLVQPVLRSAEERLLSHPRIAELYPHYLFLCHCIVRASVPLMETARRRVEELSATGGSVAGLATYLERHESDERDHDTWLLEDLESLGIPRSSILQRPPTATVASLVGAQYYWILHYHPVALLGYMAVLEWNPPSLEEIDDLVVRTGHPRAAFRTLIEHAELDPTHAQELHEAINGLRLNPEQSTLIGLSAMHTVAALAAACEELTQRPAG